MLIITHFAVFCITEISLTEEFLKLFYPITTYSCRCAMIVFVAIYFKPASSGKNVQHDEKIPSTIKSLF